MRTSVDISEKSNFPSIQENGSYLQQIQQASLFLGVFEGFIDCILTNYTYQEIAAKLFITLDTVKKHLKNIYAKQKSILNIE